MKIARGMTADWSSGFFWFSAAHEATIARVFVRGGFNGISFRPVLHA